jgi:hypothetical protein
MHEREAPGRGDDNLVGADLSMQIRILARLIDIKGMMRVLERRDAPLAKIGNKLDDQGGLSRAAPTGKADHAHDLKLRNALLEIETPIPYLPLR